MKKKFLATIASLALALTVVAPVSAATKPTGDASSDNIRNATNAVINETTKNSDNSSLKPSGVPGVEISYLLRDDKDNIYDNAIEPFVNQAVKNSLKGSGEGIKAENIDAIYYFDLTADEPGRITFKMKNAESGGYAAIYHYTGDYSDEDGLTAQYVKIKSGGRVTANFNSYSPVAIIATSNTSAQALVDTLYYTAGTDQSSGLSATIAGSENAPLLIGSCVLIVAIIIGTVAWKKKKGTTETAA